MRRDFLRILLVLAVVLWGPGCFCRKKTDEEKLKKAVDTTAVHLYLAAKIAINPTDETADVKAARKALGKVVALSGKALDKGNGAEPQHLDAKDAAALAMALWQLRSLGKEALKKDDPEIPKPILPTLVAGDELAEVIDGNTEHAILLIGLTAIKFHPKVPVPVPPEILLYEAWNTNAKKLKVASFGPFVHAIKAYTYGANELCDLAAKEAEALPEDGSGIDRKAAAKDLKKLTGESIDIPKEGGEELGAAIEVLAQGSTALCYFQRGEADKGIKPLRRLLDAADKMGMKAPELDLLRSFVECAEGGDNEKGKKLAKGLIERDDLTEEQRKMATVIAKQCGASPNALAKAIDRTLLAHAVGALALEHLRRAGITESLEKTSSYRAVRDFVTAMGEMLNAARDAVPSWEGAKDWGKSLF